MLKIFVYYIFAFFFYAMTVGFFNNFLLFGSVPNLLLILVVFLAVNEKGNFFLILSFLAGLLLDFSTGLLPGSFALGFLFAAVLLSQIGQRTVSFERNWKFLPLAFMFCQGFIYLWIYWFCLLSAKFGQGQFVFSFLFLGKRFVWDTLYGLVLLYPAWKALAASKAVLSKFSLKGK
jgi:rod shape-determining protein MreD